MLMCVQNIYADLNQCNLSRCIYGFVLKISYFREKGKSIVSSCAGLKCEPETEAGGGAGRLRVSVERETLRRRAW